MDIHDIMGLEAVTVIAAAMSSDWEAAQLQLDCCFCCCACCNCHTASVCVGNRVSARVSTYVCGMSVASPCVCVCDPRGVLATDTPWQAAGTAVFSCPMAPAT